MIERDFNKFLRKLATTELKNNQLAQVLAKYWGNPKFTTDGTITKIFDGLIDFMKMPKKTGEEKKPDQSLMPKDEKHLDLPAEKRDLRINSVRLASIRGIPPTKNGHPFGIEFRNGANGPYNAVIVGKNGSGKTSIFSALEYIYAAKVSEAELRNYKSGGKEGYNVYLTHDSSKENKYCQIETAQKETYNLEERIIDKIPVVKEINPESNFISEHDVYQYGQSTFSGEDDAFHNRIAGLLGFKQYTDCSDYLSRIKQSRRRKESDSYKRNRENQKKEQEKIKELEREIEVLESQKGKDTSSTSIIDRNLNLLTKLKQSQSETSGEISISRLKSIITDYIDTYLELKKVSLDRKNDEITFLELGLKLMEHAQGCPFCESSKNAPSIIKKEVQKRLEQYKIIKEKNESLTSYYKGILEELEYHTLKIIELKNNLETEISDLKNIKAASNLIEEERRLLDQFDIEIFTEISNKTEYLMSKSAYNQNSKDELYSFLTDNIEYIINEKLYKRMNNFIRQRPKVLEQIITGLEEEVGESRIDLKDNKELRAIQLTQQLKESEENLRTLQRELPSLKEKYEIYKRIKDESSQVLAKIEKEIAEIMELTLEPLKATIKKALEAFLQEDNMEIDIKFKEPPRADEDIGKKRLTIELVDENDVTHKPKEYLNTFRYKIFCGTIAIGVALASRKNSGMNIPLILDDEFFASDIINRAEFENYFRQIILMYRKITPSMPFQFILFTHDELIFTSAREAIENVWANIQELNEKEPVDDLNEYWKSPIVDRTFFARLFPPKEAADEPKNLRTGEKYWDLIYKFEF